MCRGVAAGPPAGEGSPPAPQLARAPPSGGGGRGGAGPPVCIFEGVLEESYQLPYQVGWGRGVLCAQQLSWVCEEGGERGAGSGGRGEDMPDEGGLYLESIWALGLDEKRGGYPQDRGVGGEAAAARACAHAGGSGPRLDADFLFWGRGAGGAEPDSWRIPSPAAGASHWACSKCKGVLCA